MRKNGKSIQMVVLTFTSRLPVDVVVPVAELPMSSIESLGFESRQELIFLLLRLSPALLSDQLIL